MKDAISFFHNDYIYMLIRNVTSENGQPAIIFCYGANTQRFRPITAERHGIGSNPVFRGLQALQSKTIVPQVLNEGGTVLQVCGDHCEPAPIGNAWWSESVELHKVSEAFAKGLVDRSLRSLTKIILDVCRPGVEVPDDIFEPDALQQFFDSLATTETAATV